METTNEALYRDTPSIKLIKNSKGYCWEIKILGIDEAALKRLAEVDNSLSLNYGSGQ